MDSTTGFHVGVEQDPAHRPANRSMSPFESASRGSCQGHRAAAGMLGIRNLWLWAPPYVAGKASAKPPRGLL